MRFVSICILLVASVSSARAQTPVWIEFDDQESPAVCGVINAANAKFIVDANTTQLIKINDTDTFLEDMVLDEFDNVLVLGEPRGFVQFRTDVDGVRGLWWITLVSGNAVELDEFTADVFDSGFRPSDLGGTRCGPEALLDNFDDNTNDNIDGGGDVGNLLGTLCGSGMIMGIVPIIGLLLLARFIRTKF